MVKYNLELKLNHLQGPTKGFLPYVPSLHARGRRQGAEKAFKLPTEPSRVPISPQLRKDYLLMMFRA